MEAYTNCRQFNCVTPIVEQTEYHMFCREKPELYMPELYNKIGVGKQKCIIIQFQPKTYIVIEFDFRFDGVVGDHHWKRIVSWRYAKYICKVSLQ